MGGDNYEILYHSWIYGIRFYNNAHFWAKRRIIDIYGHGSRYYNRKISNAYLHKEGG